MIDYGLVCGLMLFMWVVIDLIELVGGIVCFICLLGDYMMRMVSFVGISSFFVCFVVLGLYDGWYEYDACGVVFVAMMCG